MKDGQAVVNEEYQRAKYYFMLVSLQWKQEIVEWVSSKMPIPTTIWNIQKILHNDRTFSSQKAIRMLTTRKHELGISYGYIRYVKIRCI